MKKIIALSSIAFLSTAVFANADLEKRISKLEKKNDYLMKKVSEVNKQAAQDNIKFDVDFRTAVDSINYETVNGNEYSNDALLSNRLWLNMGYMPSDTMIFKGQLAYHKAYGASYGQRGTGFGFDTFDWVSSETLADDKIRVREAYWLWTPKVGDLGFTVSLGRRPSTNGFLANLREDDPKAKSPLGHVINMEFDGASAGIKLNNVLPGMLFKLCLGRGLTNATGWASQATQYINSPVGGSNQPNFTEDDNNLDTVDMAGFIFVPYDDGQYSIKTTWYRGFNVPGLYGTTIMDMDGNPMTQNDQMPTAFAMKTAGNMDGMAISVKVTGIGDGISDFLDNTTLFASYAVSKSDPKEDIYRTFVDGSGNTIMADYNTGAMMMGSAESETGNSIWVGAVMPNLTGGKFGIEYNQGSEHWRPFTYGEDTMIGSKLATRGNAIEAYWTQPLIDDSFSMQVRYTQINYDYTGSTGFFGDGGASYDIDSPMAQGMDSVETASDLRVYFRYRY